MATIAEIPREKPREQVTSTLARQILSGALAPGDCLPTEADLSGSLGGRRTALREAIRTLAGKGLIERRTRCGTVILPFESWNHLETELLAWREEMEPDIGSLGHLTEGRRVIEAAAAGFAAERATGVDPGRLWQSYDAIFRADVSDIESRVAADAAIPAAVLHASHNPFLTNFWAMIGAALRTAFRLTILASANNAATLGTHGEVLAAIRLRQPAAKTDLSASGTFEASALSFGPSLRVGGLPADIRGDWRMMRGGYEIWSKPFLAGEVAMSHAVTNLEHHHFKYDLFCQPCMVHVHKFGPAALNFGDGLRTEDGDVFGILAPGFGQELRNPFTPAFVTGGPSVVLRLL